MTFLLGPEASEYVNNVDMTVRNLEGVTSFSTYILSANGKRVLEEERLNNIRPEILGNDEMV